MADRPSQHLALLTIGTGDLARARTFYVDGLGWELVWENEEVVFVQLGHGLLLGLFGADDLAADAGTARLTAGSGSLSLAHNVGSADQVDAFVEVAAAAGAAVVKAPQRAAFGGYHAYVTDPDGVLWEVAHNPGLTFDAAGRASMAAVEG